MSNITPFKFEDFDVRVVVVDNEPWFVGKDVAECLGYKDTTNAIKQHCRGVAKHHPIQDSLGRMQETRIINEPDMYRLCASSNLESAERFESWVFEEVLPTIRKTGSYGKAALTPGEMLMASAQAMIAMEQRQAANEQNIQRIESKVEVLAESRVWDHCPQNCETISKIRVRMNERYGLPQWVIDTIMWRLPLSPKPHSMVRNQREEAKGSQYEVYAVADITRIFAQFVSECEQESPMRASHRDIDRSFQLVPTGKKPKKLKAHAVAESEAV